MYVLRATAIGDSHVQWYYVPSINGDDTRQWVCDLGNAVRLPEPDKCLTDEQYLKVNIRRKPLWTLEWVEVE